MKIQYSPDEGTGLNLLVNKDGTLEAKVTLPEGVDGTFNWKGGHYVLKSGTNRIRIKAK